MTVTFRWKEAAHDRVAAAWSRQGELAACNCSRITSIRSSLHDTGRSKVMMVSKSASKCRLFSAYMRSLCYRS